MSFDLSKYETVKQRKKRFYQDHPDGRIIVKIINLDVENKAVMEAKIFLDEEDQEKSLPKSTGHALEIRLTEKSTSRDGFQYEAVNFTSWLENAEESAIGRALDNAGYAGNDLCSKEEMEKAERHSSGLPDSGRIVTYTPGNPPVSPTKEKCSLCGASLKLSKSGRSYHCPNWKDESRGKHSMVDVQPILPKPYPDSQPPSPFTEDDIPF